MDRSRSIVASVLLVVLVAASAGGCAAPPASLDLITVARKGLAGAVEGQNASHAQQVRQLAAQSAALDAAFDADVRLAEAGQIKDAAGKPVALDAQWVIAARKGYSAARDAVAGQLVAEQAVHATRLDNLSAADDALEMASQLIVEQMALGTRLRQQLLDAQRKVAGKK